jgi:hypothetical protein
MAAWLTLSSFAEEQVLDQGRYAENQKNENKEADQTHPPHHPASRHVIDHGLSSGIVVSPS